MWLAAYWVEHLALDDTSVLTPASMTFAEVLDFEYDLIGFVPKLKSQSCLGITRL